MGDIIKLEESISEKFIESPLKVGSEVSDSPDNSSAEDDSSVIIFALWLLVFSASSQLMIVVAMLPEIGKQLSVSDAKQGLLVSIYAVMVGIFALVIGPISDKIGRRKVLLAGTGLMTAALAMHAAVFDYTGLLIVRTLAGIAGGVLSGAAVSYVGDYFPYERRGWANGWVMSGIAAGQIGGVPLGSLLAGYFGFRTPFLIFALTMGATFFLILKRVPQPKVELNANRLTIRSSFSEYLSLAKQRDIAVAALIFAMLFFSMALYITYFPAWLATTQNATQGGIAALFFTGGVASVLTGPFVGKMSDTAGRKPLILASSVGLFLMMSGITFVVREFWLAFPMFFVSSILMAARVSPFQALLSALVPGNRRGALMSLTVSLGQIGFASGAALAGFIYARFGYQASTFFGAAVVLVVAAMIWRFLPEPTGQKQ